MVDLGSLLKRNWDPEMHAASRIAGFRGDVVRAAIMRERKAGHRSRRVSSRRSRRLLKAK